MSVRIQAQQNINIVTFLTFSIVEPDLQNILAQSTRKLLNLNSTTKPWKVRCFKKIFNILANLLVERSFTQMHVKIEFAAIFLLRPTFWAKGILLTARLDGFRKKDRAGFMLRSGYGIFGAVISQHLRRSVCIRLLSVWGFGTAYCSFQVGVHPAFMLSLKLQTSKIIALVADISVIRNFKASQWIRRLATK